MEQENANQVGLMKVVFAYNDVFFSFSYDDESGCIHRSHEYAMNYVYSGEIILDNGKEQIRVGKGECVFILCIAGSLFATNNNLNSNTMENEN